MARSTRVAVAPIVMFLVLSHHFIARRGVAWRGVAWRGAAFIRAQVEGGVLLALRFVRVYLGRISARDASESNKRGYLGEVFYFPVRAQASGKVLCIE